MAEVIPGDITVPTGVAPWACDPEAAERLWTLSELRGLKWSKGFYVIWSPDSREAHEDRAGLKASSRMTGKRPLAGLRRHVPIHPYPFTTI